MSRFNGELLERVAGASEHSEELDGTPLHHTSTHALPHLDLDVVAADAAARLEAMCISDVHDDTSDLSSVASNSTANTEATFSSHSSTHTASTVDTAEAFHACAERGAAQQTPASSSAAEVHEGIVYVSQRGTPALPGEAPPPFGDEVEDCVICLGPLSKPVGLPCGHKYCKVCLDLLRDKGVQQTCPLCREPLPVSTISPLD